MTLLQKLFLGKFQIYRCLSGTRLESFALQTFTIICLRISLELRSRSIRGIFLSNLYIFFLFSLDQEFFLDLQFSSLFILDMFLGLIFFLLFLDLQYFFQLVFFYSLLWRILFQRLSNALFPTRIFLSSLGLVFFLKLFFLFILLTYFFQLIFHLLSDVVYFFSWISYCFSIFFFENIFYNLLY